MKDAVEKFLREDAGMFRSKTFSRGIYSTTVRVYPAGGPQGLTMDALIAAGKQAGNELEESGLMNPGQGDRVESNRNGVFLTWSIASDDEAFAQIKPKLEALGYKETP